MGGDARETRIARPEQMGHELNDRDVGPVRSEPVQAVSIFCRQNAGDMYARLNPKPSLSMLYKR